IAPFWSIINCCPPGVHFTCALDHPFFKDLECTIGLSKIIDKSKGYFLGNPLFGRDLSRIFPSER
ncbi:MAG: hypothetical protein ACQ9IQ_11380, partial [Nitrospirales bacterium]